MKRWTSEDLKRLRGEFAPRTPAAVVPPWRLTPTPKPRPRYFLGLSHPVAFLHRSRGSDCRLLCVAYVLLLGAAPLVAWAAQMEARSRFETEQAILAARLAPLPFTEQQLLETPPRKTDPSVFKSPSIPLPPPPPPRIREKQLQSRSAARSTGAAARILARNGFLPQALSVANGYNPRELRTQYALACIYEETGDRDRLMAALDAAILIDPGFVETRRMRGAARRQQEDYDGAVEDATVVLNADPSDLETLRLRATSLLLGSHPLAAAADFWRLVAWPQRRFEDTLGLAEAWEDANEFGRARLVLETALRDWPEGTTQRERLLAALKRIAGR